MSDATAPDMIDWKVAIGLGSRLAGEGPSVSRSEADEAVAELRADAHRSTDLVRQYTGLDAPEDTAPIMVVDRPGWVRANAEGFKIATGPLIGRLAEKKPPTGLTLAIGSKVTGVEVGALLGYMAGKVLGQYDPFHPDHGRLLLVAPNIVHVERELQVDPTDFRLWVCLHEETHRVQFTAVPWMREHLFSEIAAITETVDSASLLDGGVERLGEIVRAARSGGSVIDMVSTPEQREVLDRVTGMMSLLEGHADVVMDGVGPSVIPTVAAIREAFNKRRKGTGSLDRIVRRLLGLEQKMAQYRDGALFVRAVVDKVGMERFNTVWSGPETLPSKDEIYAPDEWIKRVL